MENHIFEFENDSSKYPEYAAWTRFQSLDFFGQDKLRKEWDSYYAACKVSYFGLMFDIAKIAYNQKDNEMLKSLIKQVKESKAKGVPKPSTYDPSELERKMHAYFEFKHETQVMKAEIGEYEPVYEAKRQTNDALEL